ncbi:DUF4158 domain-containing protein [Photorhabdus bodei]|uniref:DUF4158 domain-containing protein n=2 Tax=Photorhabdus bodei TaxID=2029681 RepID=A0A329XGF3_9GAMM|nr:DUF4158 domain-containing protein [Photorhabdus bodei]NDK97864.1 DUF4158 domain-containing protein [Photorhabdus bodei]NDL02114.1 DUF4158 domain-containing protein [Photorhabdus bodei]NDL06188.1 DUF4158 domain-containing protein [Photorhabdus bodei]RAX14382.1 hypothetical protein CKY02_00300 [Photorhabdus bodei]
MMTHHIDQTANKSKRLSALTDAKQFSLYALPNFDEGLQLEFLSLSASELEPTTNRSALYSQIYCVLQSGYFKVKHAFFRFVLSDVESDYTFVINRYFRHAAPVANHEYYTQRKLIAELFGYSLWSEKFRQQLSQRPIAKCPNTTLSKCLRPFQLTFDTDKKPVGLHFIFRRIKVNVLYSIAFEGRVLVYPR